MAQLAFGVLLGVWAWLPTMLVFWSIIAFVVRGVAGPRPLAGWLRPARGSMLWSALGVGLGLLSLPGFLSHRQILGDPSILACWAAFAVINPWFEESYWRGLLMDATRSWGAFGSMTYSAAWFAISHPLIWGIHSVAMRRGSVVIALFAVGVGWGLVYRRTQTLRWTIAGHMLANLLGLAVPVLLNMYDPTQH